MSQRLTVVLSTVGVGGLVADYREQVAELPLSRRAAIELVRRLTTHIDDELKAMAEERPQEDQWQK